jgi:hypothetical protein
VTEAFPPPAPMVSDERAVVSWHLSGVGPVLVLEDAPHAFAAAMKTVRMAGAMKDARKTPRSLRSALCLQSLRLTISAAWTDTLHAPTQGTFARLNAAKRPVLQDARKMSNSKANRGCTARVVCRVTRLAQTSVPTNCASNTMQGEPLTRSRRQSERRQKAACVTTSRSHVH